MKQDYKIIWKALARDKKNTARHMAQYCVLKAISAKAESVSEKVEIAKHLLRKAFPPVRKETKIGLGGRYPFDTVFRYDVNPFRGSNLLGEKHGDILTDEEQEMWLLMSKLLSPSALERSYSYFFTRQDIFPEYQLVQTAHAALELGANLTVEEAKDLHFTVCGVPDLENLEMVETWLSKHNIKHVVFKEPDIGNQKTSIGVYPIRESRKGKLKEFKLLKFAA